MQTHRVGLPRTDVKYRGSGMTKVNTARLKMTGNTGKAGSA